MVVDSGSNMGWAAKGKESSRAVALVQQTSEGDKSWHEPTVTTTVLFPFCLPREPKRWENNTALSFAFGVWQQKTPS